jgi:hypothetical protein
MVTRERIGDQVGEEFLEPLVHDLVVLPSPVQVAQELDVRAVLESWFHMRFKIIGHGLAEATSRG